MFDHKHSNLLNVMLFMPASYIFCTVHKSNAVEWGGKLKGGLKREGHAGRSSALVVGHTVAVLLDQKIHLVGCNKTES